MSLPDAGNSVDSVNITSSNDLMQEIAELENIAQLEFDDTEEMLSAPVDGVVDDDGGVLPTPSTAVSTVAPDADGTITSVRVRRAANVFVPTTAGTEFPTVLESSRVLSQAAKITQRRNQQRRRHQRRKQQRRRREQQQYQRKLTKTITRTHTITSTHVSSASVGEGTTLSVSLPVMLQLAPSADLSPTEPVVALDTSSLISVSAHLLDNPPLQPDPVRDYSQDLPQPGPLLDLSQHGPSKDHVQPGPSRDSNLSQFHMPMLTPHQPRPDVIIAHLKGDWLAEKASLSHALVDVNEQISRCLSRLDALLQIIPGAYIIREVQSLRWRRSQLEKIRTLIIECINNM